MLHFEASDDEPVGEKHDLTGLLLKGVALLLALIFILTLLGKWLAPFAGPAIGFLQESRELSQSQQIKELRKAVVRITAEPARGSHEGQRQGSGFNLSPEGLIVTNRHLVEEAAYVRVFFPDEGMFITGSWFEAENSDLAVIYLDGANLPVLTISSVLPKSGDDLLVIGNPLSYPRIAGEAKLVGFRADRATGFDHMVVEASIHPGSSGSPLFNSVGEVVGVIYATIDHNSEQKKLGLALSSQELLCFLQPDRCPQ